MPRAEKSVLQPLDPSQVSDSDSWPEFELRNVTVTSQADGRPVSLLKAHPTSLVTVEGTLDPVDREWAHLLKATKVPSSPIRLTDVAVYSFSQWEDGTLGFWAAGKAGWFEIRTTAKAYAPIYRQMEEATGMFYYLSDKLRSARKRPAKDTVTEREKLVKRLVKDYVNSEYSKRRDGDDAMEGFYEHRRFLMRCMLEGQEGLKWEQSPILRHFKRTYPDDFKEMQSLVEANDKAGPAPSNIMDVDPAPSKPKKNARIAAPEVHTPPQQRKRRPSATGSDADTGDDDDDDLEATVRTHGRSVLRPQGSQSAKKYVRRHPGSATATDTNAGDDEDSSDHDITGLDTPSRQQVSALIDQAPTGRSAGRPRKSEAPSIPQAAPQASYYEHVAAGAVWTCPYDGCNQRVWDARTPAARRLMEAHFAAKHADAMAELIRAEMRPYNRVAHLMRRVQDVAASGMNMDGGGDEAKKDEGKEKRGVRRKF